MSKLKINSKPDNGKSPIRTFLIDMNIAFAEGNLKFIAENISESIHWNIVGGERAEGKTAFIQLFESMKSNSVAELIFDNIITHGKEAAVSGSIIMNDGKKYSFADIYVFESTGKTIIKSITSYIINI